MSLLQLYTGLHKKKTHLKKKDPNRKLYLELCVYCVGHIKKLIHMCCYIWAVDYSR